jgi:Uma2 family endonuclease
MAEKDQAKKPLLTAKDLQEMGEEGEFCELVDGELVKMSPSFLPEARVVCTIFLLLDTFVAQYRLGEVFGPDLGYELTPHRVRTPDVSFVSAKKLATYGTPQEFAKIVPDLVVEVISATQDPRLLRSRRPPSVDRRSPNADRDRPPLSGRSACPHYR